MTFLYFNFNSFKLIILKTKLKPIRSPIYQFILPHFIHWFIYLFICFFKFFNFSIQKFMFNLKLFLFCEFFPLQIPYSFFFLFFQNFFVLKKTFSSFHLGIKYVHMFLVKLIIFFFPKIFPSESCNDKFKSSS